MELTYLINYLQKVRALLEIHCVNQKYLHYLSQQSSLCAHLLFLLLVYTCFFSNCNNYLTHTLPLLRHVPLKMPLLLKRMECRRTLEDLWIEPALLSRQQVVLLNWAEHSFPVLLSYSVLFFKRKRPLLANDSSSSIHVASVWTALLTCCGAGSSDCPWPEQPGILSTTPPFFFVKIRKASSSSVQ